MSSETKVSSNTSSDLQNNLQNIIKVYLENPVGIGEHPQIVDEVDKQISSICKAKEKLEELKNFED